MKKKYLKRAGGVLLALALTLGSLTACGRDSGSGSGSGSQGGSGGAGGSGASGGGGYANATLAKENVYSYQELKLPDLGGDDLSIRGSSRVGDKIYLLLLVYHWEENSQTDYRLLSINQDGSNVESVQLLSPTDRPEGAAEGAGESESDAQEESQPEATEGETDVEIDPGFAVDPGFSVDVAVDSDYYMESSIWEYTYYGNFVFGENGIYSIKNYNYENYTDPENYISTSTTYVCGWDYDGNFLWQTELEGMRSDEEYIYVNTMAEGSDGSLALFMTGNSLYQQSVETDGTLGGRRTLDDDLYDIFSYSGTFMPTDDGSLMVLYYGEDYMTQYLAKYDIAAGTFGEPSTLPSTLSWGGYSSMAIGLNSDLVYTTREGVFTFNIGDEFGTKKMDFINSDMDITSFQSMIELGEDSLFGVFYDNYDGGVRGGIFTYVPPEDVPDKKVMILAGNYVGYDMRHRVVEFNRNSQEYRITIKDYDEYSTYEDYMAGMNMLNSDIITGNMPDILILNSSMSVNNYISKGLLADVGALIESDEEMSQVEFLQNVFDAYSVDGKLYQVIPCFGIGTMMAKTSLVGDRTSWTMSDMQQVLDSMPEDTVAIEGLTRDWFFSMMMQYDGSDFVDVNTGKCNFNTENFIALMEFGKSLPEEIQYDDDYWMNYNGESQFRENKTLLYQTTIWRVSDLNRIINGYFGEDVSFVGFPTDSGQGGIVYAYSSYAISAKSDNIDGAWQFLRYYLTEEYQDTLTYDLSIRKDVFEAKAREALERPYWLDVDGNKEEYDEIFYMNGEEITLEPMTQEQLNEILTYIYSVDKPYYVNEDVTNIINEEMDAFYTGQKNARDVAGIIQNRVQLFVDENS